MFIQPREAMAMSVEMLTVKELCERLQITRSTLTRWVGSGLAPRPILLGARTVRFRAIDVDRWLGDETFAAEHGDRETAATAVAADSDT
jgi:excisionase family DNA binding protein